MWLDGRRLLERPADGRGRFPDSAGRSAAPRGAHRLCGDLKRWWPMVQRAAGFLACNGPVTQQDRWEEDAGYSPFTLAVEIAGLLAAADVAEAVGRSVASRPTCASWPIPGTKTSSAGRIRPTADLAQQIGVDGYYVRIAPPETDWPLRRRKASCRSRTGRPGESGSGVAHRQPGRARAGALRSARSG